MSLYHSLFTAVDSLPEALVHPPNYVRNYLEQQVEEQAGYWSSQVEEYAAMLVEEFCSTESAEVA